MALAPSALAAAMLAAAVLLPSGSLDQAQTGIAPKYRGVNLASAEFAPKKLPGVAGQDYIYPTKATAEPFAAMGMNSIRLPFLWERIQPEAKGPLNEEEAKRLDASLNDLRGFEQVILDLHNYGRFRGKPLARADRSADALADLWTRLAQRYKDRPGIAFGIMNEPHGIRATEWRAIAEETTAAIRRTGARNLILVPGSNWTGGHSWHNGGDGDNGAALAGFIDPGRNFAFEIHQYLDRDSSGSNPGCSGPRIGTERLQAVTRWLRQQKARAVLGEFGVDSSPACLAALDDMLGFLRQNGDVWIGWNYWAGGDWWGDYALGIQPKNGKERPQAAVLRKYLGR
ncbi:glycoside hydrolase family 5 protein [Sphingomonas sp. LHG3406-1]|uniref:glycoside hydrolase family 5 protein n=1 Tax=Sphingomonas sp. LHG3406-1 TaxID=2804617 RepID=UPI002626F56F|nr:glycoside hydrolase family 5 protein [Sphingomonas sp. LHG3406-1]